MIQIDSKRLADAGIELRSLVQDETSAAAPADGDENQPLFALLNQREGNLITKLLTTSRSGKILAEPSAL